MSGTTAPEGQQDLTQDVATVTQEFVDVEPVVAAPDAPRAVEGWTFRFPPGPDIEERLAAVAAAPNPLLEAAQPLLCALADMPQDLRTDREVEACKTLLSDELRNFQSLCDKAALNREHVLAVRYCLCTALDERAHDAVLSAGGAEQAGRWSKDGLLLRFHDEVYGGEKFFLLIGRLAGSPHEHLPVLEVLYRILGLGFEGRYSMASDGRRQLENIRYRLLTLISGSRESVARELSPRWQGDPVGRLPLMRAVPLWATVTLLTLMLFGLFAWYKYQLLSAGDLLRQQIVDIGKGPPPWQPLKLAVLLKDEIARGLVNVVDDARSSTVTFRGDDMFVPGQAQVNNRITAVLQKVGLEINKVEGRVQVIGHSDNQPIATPAFPSNQVLSEKRAASVAQYLESQGVPRARLEVLGKGDGEPLTSNATAAGRARNRRVDIVVAE